MKRYFVMVISIFLLILFLTGYLIAKDSEVCNILRVLQQKINEKIPILDSLYIVDSKFESSSDVKLTQNDRKVLKLFNKRQKGVIINIDCLKNKCISARSIFKALRNLNDTLNLAIFVKSKPFYMVSYPSFFRGNDRAIVYVDLIGSYGYTYILEKKINNWVIIKESLRWIV